MSAAVQTRLPVGGWALPIDPDRLARENDFEIRHQLRSLDLSDEQIAAAEAPVEMVRLGAYPAPARSAA